VRRAASGRVIAQGRFPVQTQAASFHAGPVLRDEEKQAEAPAKGNFFLESLGDWHRAVPIGVAMAIPAVQLDVYMITEETQLFCCFMLFVGTAYSLGGNAFGAFMDEKGQAILKEHHAVEDLQIAEVEATLATHQAVLSAQDDIKSLFVTQKDLLEGIKDATELKLKHKIRERVVARLNTVVQAETALTNSVQGSLVNAATSNIQAAFTNDDGKLKDAALSYAMDALAGKDVDADQVAAMYSKFISDFGSDLAKVNGTEVALSPEATAVIADELEAIKRRDGLEGWETTSPTKVLMNL